MRYLADTRSIAAYGGQMPSYRPGQVADLLGVSADTVRRWCDDGRLATSRTERGDRVIDGADLAAFLESAAGQVEIPAIGASSARNRFTGIVTKVTSDDIVAKVELAAGPYRLVSVLTSEAAEELKLAPGVLAVASVKSTDVVISLPAAS